MTIQIGRLHPTRSTRPRARLRTSLVRFVRLVAVCGAAVWLPACHQTTPSGPDPRQQLAAARQLWTAAAPSHYDYRLTRACFCTSEIRLPLDIRVEQGRVTSAWRSPSHDPVNLALAMPIDSLFALIEGALDSGYETVDVQYDARLGYPTALHLDRANLADAGLTATAQLLCQAEAQDATTACDCAADPQARLYRFVARGAAGDTLATGCLGLVFTPKSGLPNPYRREAIVGRRCFTPRCGAAVPPALPGDWGVAGEMDAAGQLTLNLNNLAADFNIFLVGHYTASPADHGTFTGDWTYSTIVGPQASGTFVAVREP